MDVAEWLRGVGLEQYAPRSTTTILTGRFYAGSRLRICVSLELLRSATAACSTPSSLSEIYRQPKGRPLLPRPQLPLPRPSGAS